MLHPRILRLPSCHLGGWALPGTAHLLGSCPWAAARSLSLGKRRWRAGSVRVWKPRREVSPGRSAEIPVPGSPNAWTSGQPGPSSRDPQDPHNNPRRWRQVCWPRCEPQGSSSRTWRFSDGPSVNHPPLWSAPSRAGRTVGHRGRSPARRAARQWGTGLRLPPLVSTVSVRYCSSILRRNEKASLRSARLRWALLQREGRRWVGAATQWQVCRDWSPWREAGAPGREEPGPRDAGGERPVLTGKPAPRAGGRMTEGGQAPLTHTGPGLTRWTDPLPGRGVLSWGVGRPLFTRSRPASAQTPGPPGAVPSAHSPGVLGVNTQLTAGP